MTGLAARLGQLETMRRRFADLAGAAAGGMAAGAAPRVTQLTEVRDFGPNPGALKMHVYRPGKLAPNPGLVVVMHGCTQDAAGYDAGAGWSTMAERYGFVVVCPEQTRVNNAKTCFNWFMPDDIARDGGEARSIRAMVAHAVEAYGIDPSRIFATGLSAGGAMTAVMLATYPEVFAAGAIVAGLPYGGARNAQGALDLMFHPQPRPAREWGDRVRSASSHAGPWPRVSVWHGAQDAVVKPANAGETVKQWTDLHGLAAEPDARDRIGSHLRETWRDRAGRGVVESYTIAGLGHGTPLATEAGEEACGQAGPYLIEAGISSTWHIAQFFGLTGQKVGQDRVPTPTEAPRATGAGKSVQGKLGGWSVLPASTATPDRPASSVVPEPIATVIDKALRSAGLLK